MCLSFSVYFMCVWSASLECARILYVFADAFLCVCVCIKFTLVTLLLVLLHNLPPKVLNIWIQCNAIRIATPSWWPSNYCWIHLSSYWKNSIRMVLGYLCHFYIGTLCRLYRRIDMSILRPAPSMCVCVQLFSHNFFGIFILKLCVGLALFCGAFSIDHLRLNLMVSFEIWLSFISFESHFAKCVWNHPFIEFKSNSKYACLSIDRNTCLYNVYSFDYII